MIKRNPDFKWEDGVRKLWDAAITVHPGWRGLIFSVVIALAFWRDSLVDKMEYQLLVVPKPDQLVLVEGKVIDVVHEGSRRFRQEYAIIRDKAGRERRFQCGQGRASAICVKRKVMKQGGWDDDTRHPVPIRVWAFHPHRPNLPLAERGNVIFCTYGARTTECDIAMRTRTYHEINRKMIAEANGGPSLFAIIFWYPLVGLAGYRLWVWIRLRFAKRS